MRTKLKKGIILLILFILLINFPSYSTDAYGTPNKVIDKNWFKADGIYLQALAGQSKTAHLNTEINELSLILDELEQGGIKGKRGYMIYLPENSEKQSLVKLAILARKDLIKRPSDYYDIVTNYYYKNYFVCGWRPLHYDKEEPVQNFDVDKIMKTIDSLAVPDSLLKGLKIYIASYRNEVVLGSTVTPNLKGSSFDSIVLFKSNNLKTYRHNIVHEVGHVLGFELSNNYLLGVGVKNDFYDEYAGIYGKTLLDFPVPGYDKPADWIKCPAENFAEDFVQVSLPNEEKLTSWGPTKMLEYRQLIEKHRGDSIFDPIQTTLANYVGAKYYGER